MRAEGVPTRLCSGIVDVDNRFYYHEWAETYIGKQYGWVAVDPTLDQHIADATHIVVDYGDNSTPSGTTLHILSAS
jgi:transglutaminase-like putative cysteine protease